MTGDRSIFKSLKEKVGEYVTFGDGSHAQVLGKRTIEIPGLPLLKDVQYIKELKANLLSITQICDEDSLVQFSKIRCVIINGVGIQVLEGLGPPTIAMEWFLHQISLVGVPESMCWNFGIKDSAMQTSNKWRKCPNLKTLWGSQNLRRWRKPFVALVKWENKQRKIIKS